ncbi:Cerato-platanin [Cubamyces sp. BRFM 1775]|nr:Cerato-platanin [Cubamyces sp. BRFM 1775]
MQFTSLTTLVVVVAAALFTGAVTTTATWDDAYDNFTGDLNTVACSNGENGMITKGFTTFGSLPNWPFIGATDAIAGYDSPNCGTCWELTYKGKGFTILAIDHAAEGFNISKVALEQLTDGAGIPLGHVEVDAAQIPIERCGLSA